MTSHPRPQPFPVCDLHCDTVLEVQGGADLKRGNPDGHVDLRRLREGGVGLQVFACFIPPVLPEGRAHLAALRLLDEVDRVCSEAPGDFAKVETAADAEAALAEGRIGVLAAVENGHAIECDLSKLAALRRRGVRYLTLTHARHLPWAASSGEKWESPHGLTDFGEDVVREMERLGMIVDISHVHERTFWDVMRISRKPVIASHSCAAALCPLDRNLTDDQLEAIAATGGMAGVNFCPGFLDPSYFAEHGVTLQQTFADFERIEEEFADDPARKMTEVHRVAREIRRQYGPARATVDTIADHILHMVGKVGDAHVGFGSDFDGLMDLPRDVEGPSAYPRILARLAERGLGPESLRRIAWENFLRVLSAHDR